MWGMEVELHQARKSSRLAMKSKSLGDKKRNTLKKKNQIEARSADENVVNKESEVEQQDEAEFQCIICKKVLTRKSTFDSHMFRHSGERPYQCAQCPRSFSMKAYLSRHLVSHSGEKKFQCHVCSKWFSYKSGLNVHLLTHQEGSSIECPQCSKSFRTKASLTQHMYLHTSVPDQPTCDVCGKTYTCKAYLIKHMHTHTGKKRHYCPTCGKGFLSKQSYDEHQHRHSQQKLVQCDMCGRRYYNKKELKKHMKFHTTVTNFHCDTCKMYFSSHNALTKHNTKVHAAVYTCSICGLTFVNKRKLASHMVMDHDSRKSVEVMKKPRNQLANFKKAKCVFCQKVVSNKYRLQSHLVNKHQLTKEQISEQNLLADSEAGVGLQKNMVEYHIDMIDPNYVEQAKNEDQIDPAGMEISVMEDVDDIGGQANNEITVFIASPDREGIDCRGYKQVQEVANIICADGDPGRDIGDELVRQIRTNGSAINDTSVESADIVNDIVDANEYNEGGIGHLMRIDNLKTGQERIETVGADNVIQEGTHICHLEEENNSSDADCYVNELSSEGGPPKALMSSFQNCINQNGNIPESGQFTIIPQGENEVFSDRKVVEDNNVYLVVGEREAGHGVEGREGAGSVSEGVDEDRETVVIYKDEEGRIIDKADLDNYEIISTETGFNLNNVMPANLESLLTKDKLEKANNNKRRRGNVSATNANKKQTTANNLKQRAKGTNHKQREYKYEIVIENLGEADERISLPREIAKKTEVQNFATENNVESSLDASLPQTDSYTEFQMFERVLKAKICKLGQFRQLDGFLERMEQTFRTLRTSRSQKPRPVID